MGAKDCCDAALLLTGPARGGQDGNAHVPRGNRPLVLHGVQREVACKMSA
jgi:hypothetical protein